MRILLINEYFPPVAPGGAEWSVYYLADALVQRNHAVGLATVNHGHPVQVPHGVQSFDMPFPFHLAKGQTKHRQGVLENPLFHGAFALFLSRVVRRFQPDILHVQSKNALLAGTLVSKTIGIPLVYTLRDIGITCPFGMCFVNGRDVERCSFETCLRSCSRYLVEHYSRNRIWDSLKVRLLGLALYPETRLKQWCLKQASGLISPSQGLLNALPSRLRHTGTWTIIPHLPPTARNGNPAVAQSSDNHPFEKRFVLYMGKISPGKGVPVLIDAVKEIAADFPDVEFLFAGKGKWDAPANLPVRSLGSIEHQAAISLMRRSECIVVPSVVPEAFNRVVIEAMSVGRPVITTDAGSLPEQVQDQITGLVVPRGSSPALAAALRRILRDPALARQFGENGQRRVQDLYTPATTLTQLESLYSRTLQRSETTRWFWLNRPFRIGLKAVCFFNDKAKRLAINLVRWTGKSSQKVHPKNLLENESSYAWYKRYLAPEDRVLDIGAGVGTHTFIAAACCRQVVGLEYDPRNLSTCIHRMNERQIQNLEFLSANVENSLPFADGTFSKVMLLDVLEHLNKRDHVLREIHRVLKPEGRLLVAIPNRRTSWKRRLQRAGLFYYSDRDHKIEYTEDEITDELTRNGFAISQPFETIVVDTPWVGLIDIVGGFSLGLYRKLMHWKVDYARRHPEESIGWQIVASRN